jgi:hypothetical protein
MATTSARERIAWLLAGESACWLVDEGATCDPGATAVVLDGALGTGDRGRRQLEAIRGSRRPGR